MREFIDEAGEFLVHFMAMVGIKGLAALVTIMLAITAFFGIVMPIKHFVAKTLNPPVAASASPFTNGDK